MFYCHKPKYWRYRKFGLVLALAAHPEWAIIFWGISLKNKTANLPVAEQKETEDHHSQLVSSSGNHDCTKVQSRRYWGYITFWHDAGTGGKVRETIESVALIHREPWISMQYFMELFRCFSLNYPFFGISYQRRQNVCSVAQMYSHFLNQIQYNI